MEKLRVGGFLTGQTLTADDTWFVWRSVYGHGFKVARSAVQAVTVDKDGWGKATLRVIGAGAELGKVEKLPIPLAEQAQAWLTERITQQ